MRRDPYFGPNLPSYNQSGLWSLHKQYMRQQASSWNIDETPSEYVRPNDWLTMPIIDDSEQKFAGLFAVYNNQSNFVSITATNDFIVDWGDGTSPVNCNSGTVASYNFNFDNIDPETITADGYRQVIITVIPQVGNDLQSLNICGYNPSQPTTANGWLDVEINAEFLNSLSFDNNSSATSAGNISQVIIRDNSISNWNGLLGSCTNLQYVDLDMSSATTASGMFTKYPLTALKLTTVKLKNTENVTNFSLLFSGCPILRTVSEFSTSSCTNFQGMFYGCLSLQAIPPFDTSNGTNFQSMFSTCINLQTIPQLDTSSGTNFVSMFERSGIFSIPLLDTSNGTDFSSMFGYCYRLLSLPAFNTSLCTNFSRFLLNCYSLVSIPALDTSSCTNFDHMFDGCYSLKGIPVLDLSIGINFNHMFKDCSSLERIPLMVTSSGTNMSNMFSGCGALRLVPLFDTSNVTNFSNMFAECGQLTNIPLFDTSSGTNFNAMFQNCSSLISIPLLDTSSGVDFGVMFNACRNLISCPNLDTSNGEIFDAMFFNCTAIEKIGSLDLTNGLSFSATFNSNTSLGNLAATGMTESFSISSCKLSKSNLEEMFINMGIAQTGSETVNISNNWGIGQSTVKTGITTAGSNVIILGDTSGISVDMLVTGTGVFEPIAVSFEPTGNLVVLNDHGLQNNTVVAFDSIISTSGISIHTPYFVTNSTINNFQISSNKQGSYIPLIDSGTGDIMYPSYVSNVIVDTSVIITAPATSSNGSGSLQFNSLDTTYPILKNWTIIG